MRQIIFRLCTMEDVIELVAHNKSVQYIVIKTTDMYS